MSWSPSTRSPVASAARHRSASPSSAKPASALCSTTARCRSSRWVDPQPSLMFSPSGLADGDHLLRLRARRRAEPRRRPHLCAVEHDPQPVERARTVATRWLTYSRPASSRSVTRPTRPGRARTDRCRATLRSRPRPRRRALPTARKELDAVVRHRVVGGGDHHAEIGVSRIGQEGDSRSGQHAQPSYVDPGRGEPGHHRRPEELAGGAGITPDNGATGRASEEDPALPRT